MRHMKVLDVLALDHGSSSSCQVPKVPDRYIVVVGQVGLALACEEPVHFSFVLELGCKLSRSHFDHLVDRWLDLVLVWLGILHY